MIKAFKIIFYFCAVYFFLMGAGLIFFPEFLIIGTAGAEVNPTIIGMLRGAGGSIVPYSLLYMLVAMDPFKRMWAMPVIAVANVIAIILDFGSVFLGEYKLSYAMIDVPVEFLSLTGIILCWFINRTGKNVESRSNKRSTPIG